MKLLPIDFPDLSETPLQRKLRAWEREDEHQRRERLRLWEEVRVKVEQLPALMDEADGSLTQGYIDGSGTLQRITQPVLVGGFTSISTLPPTERMHHATLPYNPAQEPHWYHATWYHAQRQNVLRLASHAEPNRLGVCSPCQAPQVLCGIQ